MRRERLPGEVIYIYLVPVPVLIKINNCAQMEVMMRRERLPGEVIDMYLVPVLVLIKFTTIVLKWRS